MYIVACYDISDNARRTRLHELLLGYGTPVQFSVFECELDPKQFRRLEKEAGRYVRKGESIRYYQLCRRCRQRTEAEGTRLIEAGNGEDFRV